MKAVKLLQAIEDRMAADQGSLFRKLEGLNFPLASDAYREDDNGFRSHLGASVLGQECSRKIWYIFHWVYKETFSGRLLRLFNRGHLEEARIISALQMVGVTVWQHNDDGTQFRIIDHNGHFGGSLDGVVRGIHDMPSEPMNAEFKTHNDKSFIKLKDEGLLKSKWEHFVQMQIYMGKLGLKYGIYIAVNKNNDELHAEIIQFDEAVYKRLLERAGQLINQPSPPPRLNKSPGWFKCKFCAFHPICFSDLPPLVNCRTCKNSTPIENGEWYCRLKQIILPKSLMPTGCEEYEINPTIKV